MKPITTDDIARYNLKFHRKEDARTFLGRRTLSGEYKIYDTQEQTFWLLTKYALQERFTSDPLNSKAGKIAWTQKNRIRRSTALPKS